MVKTFASFDDDKDVTGIEEDSEEKGLL